ncbi:hypothetical protein BCR42DRAFT_331704 [Absidia repens]|uniref:FAD-binding domain-containing protein n=1 Tax=Absidia repens TaxID=90262 RepID=A0A1X2I9N5_9FUNG|nr:hypothetical protein BCR42DRAFT_331704 [Absidia repens]
MHSRMVHLGQEGHQMSQAYSIHGEHINAVDRARLNELLLDQAENLANVDIHFEHELYQADFGKGSMVFLQGDDKIKVTKEADFIVGADGAYSKMRAQMMRKIRMNYEQEYIDTGYCELYMPPKVVNGVDTYALDPNHLHIWPRHSFMLIALPNPDKSFTCTLFMPFDMFEQINSNTKLMSFFETNFKDAIPLIGKDRLVDDYQSNPRGALISIKTSPHHISDKAVIVGDAAHAMVPFYGQGMNCGFQDIEVFHQVFDQHHVRPVLSHDGTVPGLREALAAYSDERVKDAHAICDLAMYNHYEMRSAVTSMRYLARKKLEGWIHYYMPRIITPLYSMVSFSTLPYSQAVQRWHRQSFWLNMVMGSLAVTSTSVAGYVVWRMLHGSSSSSRLSLPPPPPPPSSGRSVFIPGVVSSGIKTTANVVNSSVASVGNLASTAGSSLGINRDTVNQVQDQVKSAAGYVTQWWWK